MPNAIRIISQLNQQRMTENLRAGFRRALLQVPGARDFQFYENTCNVWADHDMQRLTTLDIAITLDVIATFQWSENAGNKILRGIINQDIEKSCDI